MAETVSSTALSMFDAIVRAAPEWPAVESASGETWTYAELSKKADIAAQYLSCQGVAPGELVGVYLNRSPELLALLLGIWRVGAVYVPLSCQHPHQFTGQLIHALRIAKVVTTKTATGLPTSVQQVVIDWDSPSKVAFPEERDLGSSPAYVIFTSGSTGHPKGVLVDHGALASQLIWYRKDLSLRQSDRVLFKYDIAADASLSEALGTLTQGAVLVVCPTGMERRADALARFIATAEISVIDVTPHLLEALVNSQLLTRAVSLRRIISGGDVLSPDIVDRVLEHSRAELFNLYGPTEATITATYDRVRRGGALSIGRPVSGMQVDLLDAEFRLVAPGEIGEICLSGRQLAQRYLPPSDDAARFIRRTECINGRGYLTGDQGRWLPDGRLEFLGRLDRQLKRRGFRIELAEIEHAILAEPGILDCAVDTFEDAGSAICAWLVAEPGNSQNCTVRLKSALKRKLPKYMVPSWLFLRDSIPRATDGTVDYRRLKSEHLDDVRRRSVSAAKRAVETKLIRILHERLQLKVENRDSDLFEFGLDSLGSVNLVTAIECEFSITLEVEDIIRGRSIAGIGELLLRSTPRKRAQSSTELPAWGSAPKQTLNVVQRSLLRLQSQGEGQLEATGVSIQWPGKLDVACFQEAFSRVILRHSALTHSFQSDEHGHWQIKSVSSEPCDPELPIWSSIHHDVEDRPSVTVVAHPAACDESSVRIVLRDLSRWYFHLLDGCDCPSDLRWTCWDYSYWAMKCSRTEQFREIKQKVALLAKPMLSCSVERLPPAVLSSAYDTLSVRICGQAWHILMNHLESDANSRKGVVATCIVLAFRKLRIPIDALAIQISGRSGVPQCEGIVGCFPSVLPVVLPSVNGSDSPRDVLEAVQTSLADYEEQRLLPLAWAELLNEVGLCTAVSPAVALDYKRLAERSDHGTIIATPRRASQLQSRPLRIEFLDNGAEAVMTWTFREDHFTRSAVSNLACAFDAALSEVARQS